MKRLVSLACGFFIGLSCMVRGGEIKYSTSANHQGNPVLNISTLTFRYSNVYTTISAKVAEIAQSTTDLKLTANNSNYVVLWSTQSISASKTFQSSTTFGNKIAVTTITYADGSLQASNSYFYYSDETQSDTTAGTWQTKLGSTITALGTYMLSYQAETSNNSNNKSVLFRVYCPLTNIEFANHEYVLYSNADKWNLTSGFIIATTTTTCGAQIQWQAGAGGGTAKIRRARLFYKKLF